MSNTTIVGERRQSRTPLTIGAVLAVIAAGGILLLVVGSGIPWGYGFAQFGSAPVLLAENEFPALADLADAADADLNRFIPGYTALGIVLVLVASLMRGRQRGDGRFVTKISLLLAVGVAADVIETVLFRSTVNGLIDGVDPTELADQVLFTRVAFVVKFAALLSALVGLAVLVNRPTRR